MLLKHGSTPPLLVDSAGPVLHGRCPERPDVENIRLVMDNLGYSQGKVILRGGKH